MTALIPYVGSERRAARHGGADINGRMPDLADKLGPYGESRALHLFRQGHDSIAIAWLLACTPAAAANALANARDLERGQ